MSQGLNLQQQLQQLSQQSAQDFYAQSIGSLKSQIQNYREQLEQYSQQLPEGDAKAQIEEMTDYYVELEGSIDQAAQDQGIQDQVNEAAQSTQQKITDFAQGAAQQAQDTAGQATDQAQQVAGQAQDAAGQAAQQGQQVAQQGQQAAQQAAGGGQQPEATHAAQQKAQDLGVDLNQVQGSGAQGRITVKDVISASNQ